MKHKTSLTAIPDNGKFKMQYIFRDLDSWITMQT